VDTEEVVYYHSDAIGSVRMVTGVEGAVIERHDFQPFGKEVAGTLPIQLGFAGAEKDSETETSSSLGFNYLGARQLHGASGRFIGVDPEHVGGSFVNPQSWNGYAYAGNNPFRFVDPDGRQQCETTYCVDVHAGIPEAQLAQEQADATSQLVAGRLHFGFGDGPPPTVPCELLRTDCNAPVLTENQRLWLGAALDIAMVIPGLEELGLFKLIGRGARATRTGRLLLNSPIRITEARMAHVVERHTLNNIAKFASKSKFGECENLTELIASGAQQQMLRQANGNFARTWDVGRSVGVDVYTGRPTSIMTVITSSDGTLVTAFPGRPLMR
jgi:RHS repeat-associated protein